MVSTTNESSSSGSGEEEESSSPELLGAPPTLTLHEHLHRQLVQLISVSSSSEEDNNTPPIELLTSCSPHELLQMGKDEERRENKVNVVKRLTDTLRLDQTSSSSTSAISKVGSDISEDSSSKYYSGKIHGCVGSHWDLLPPEYAAPADVDNNTPSSSTAGNNDDDKDDTTNDNDDDDAATTSTQEEEVDITPTVRGGGLRLPGLDWNKTFKKGYSVLVWVRPTLEQGGNSTTTNTASTSPRKQVLYRFATSETDGIKGSIGVCAILGQWSAANITTNSSQTMLTTTVTAYILPNSDPMAYLYPAGKDDDTTTDDNNKNTTTTADDDNNNNNNNTNMDNNNKGSGGPPSSPPPHRRRRASIEFQPGSISSSSAHARNMEHFQKQSRQNKKAATAAAASTDGRLLSKAKKTGKKVVPTTTTSPNNNNNNNHKGNYNTASVEDSLNSRYCTAQLTLPADEWSLISIQHTHLDDSLHYRKQLGHIYCLRSNSGTLPKA